MYVSMPHMKICIHRGTKEIGGSCVEIEAGGESILIDSGMPLTSDSESPPTPPIIDGRSLHGIVISHPHQDHYGLLPWMPTAPVLMGDAARRILRAAAPFMRQPPLNLDGPSLVDRQAVNLGPFRITPYLVDHSAYDSYALLIEADGKRLFYSGDVRMHGRKRKLVERLMATPPAPIDALLLEGTTLGRASNIAPKPEDEIEDEVTEIFRDTTGIALVHVSAQNIDRLVSIFRACLKTHRTLVVDLYTAEILAATGNSHIPQSDWNRIALCIPQRQRLQIKNACLFGALERHARHRIFPRDIAKNPGAYALIFRELWMSDLERANCLDGACLIHSQWDGYLKEDRFRKIDAWRQAHSMPFHQVHTSGHASPDDLKRLVAALNPKMLVPIHTDAPERYSELYPYVTAHTDGEWWEI
jgi:ribonuclease J